MTQNHSSNNPTDALVITRIFDAPRELVWRAWTDPTYYMRWWGPKDFTSPTSKIDLRVGGKYVSSMQSAEGQMFYSAGTYTEIVPMERLVFTDSFADADGNIVEPTEYGMDASFPRELTVIVTFEDHDGKTKMTMTHIGMPAGEGREMTNAGWEQSFDKLAHSLQAA